MVTHTEPGYEQSPMVLGTFKSLGKAVEVTQKFATAFFELEAEDQAEMRKISKEEAMEFTEEVVLDYFKYLDKEQIEDMLETKCFTGLIARISFSMGLSVYSFHLEVKETAA